MILYAPCGVMEGLEFDGLCQFRGIPYAEPPLGENRFRPAVSAKPWGGIRSCKAYGHAAPQVLVPGLTYFQEGETIDENCLYLNVTAPAYALPGQHPTATGAAEPSVPGSPAVKRAGASAALPVLFWVHGGAFQKGSANMGMDPAAFAKEGVVIVAANYRVGALGFLDFSEFLGDDYRQSGNNGLLDIMEALRWTKRNIASFGGDPDNITIMGQSAGAKLCAALTLASGAKGLFRRAILCSGAAQCIRDQATARAVTRRFMTDAGLSEETAGQLLTLPWETILKAQQNLFSGLNLHTVGPVFDGITFPADDALQLIEAGVSNQIDVLMGTDRDEMNLYWYIYQFHELTEAHALRLFGDYASKVMTDYRQLPSGESFHKNFIHLLTEYIYRGPCIRMAEACAAAGQKIYLYRLDWDRQPYRACHTSETQFLMGKDDNLPGLDASPAHERLSRMMHDAFMHFIKTGKPEAEGLPFWPLYTKDEKQMMVFDDPCRTIAAPEPETPEDMPFQIFRLNEIT